MEGTDGALYGRFIDRSKPDRKEAPKVPEQAVLDGIAVEEDNECENCGQQAAELFHNDRFGGALCEGCDSAYGMVECEACGNSVAEDESHWSDYYDAALCESCYYDRRCGECGSDHGSDDDAYECCRSRCQECGESYEYEEDARNCCSSEFSGEMPYLPAIDTPYRVSVPEIPGRPARLCSLEQELAKGGQMVARLLYDIGVADGPGVESYHYGGSRRGRAHVEDDGSLPDEGGEVVYDRFDLDRSDHVESLSLALAKIRQLRDLPSRPVGTSYAAGIHVHIAARAVDGTTMTSRDTAALYELWSYAEDMLYSLSAAGWNRHRQPNDAYGGYCKPVPKVEGEASAAKVWRVMRSDRYFGLNFQRLYNAVSRCSCGAATMGDWPACECGAFDGATVEWRVFNSSTLPRTIHAWLLFAHAMTAYSAQHELGTLPVNALGSTSREEKREVLNHLLDILPLTEGEKDVILEAANRSPGL